MPRTTDAAPGKSGVHNVQTESTDSNANGRVGRRKRRHRSTTYTQEAYRQRAAGRLSTLRNASAARDVYFLVAHLLDRFGRDAVLFRHDELATMLDCDARTIRRGVESLDAAGLLVAEPVHGRRGYRDKSRLSLPDMPETARWFEPTPTGQNCPLGEPDERPTGQNCRAYRSELSGSSVEQSVEQSNFSLGHGSAVAVADAEQLAAEIAKTLDKSPWLVVGDETRADLAEVVTWERDAAARENGGGIVPDDVFLDTAQLLADDPDVTENVGGRYRQMLRTCNPMQEWKAGYR